MNTMFPYFRLLPACLFLCGILLGPGVSVASAQDLADVPAELRRTNQRLEGLERRLSGIEALLGGEEAGATLADCGKSVGFRPVGEDPATSPLRPVPTLPSAFQEYHFAEQQYGEIDEVYKVADAMARSNRRLNEQLGGGTAPISVDTQLLMRHGGAFQLYLQAKERFEAFE